VNEAAAKIGRRFHLARCAGRAIAALAPIAAGAFDPALT